MDCWFDMRQLDLEFRQHSLCKGLGQCQLSCNQVLVIWNFIWYIIEDPFEFICNMIIVKLLFWTCDLCIMEFICYMGKFEEDHGVTKLGCGYLYLMPCSSSWYIMHYLLLDSNVQGNLGFYMTLLSIGLHPIRQIFSTLNF